MVQEEVEDLDGSLIHTEVAEEMGVVLTIVDMILATGGMIVLIIMVIGVVDTKRRREIDLKRVLFVKALITIYVWLVSGGEMNRYNDIEFLT